MLHDIVKKGSTDRSVTVRIIDSTDGTPETGVVYNTSGIDLWYRREGAAKTSITEADLATPALTDAHADGGFLHVGDGVYRLDLPDAAFATGANYVDFGGTVTGMVVIGGRVRLVNYDLEDAVRLGLTALPNAAADAAGGLPISDAGGLDLDAKLANTNEVTAARMGALTDWIDGGRLDLIIDSILTDTGTTLQGELDGIQADTEDIQTRLPAALVSGRIDASVGAMAANVLTAASMAADASAEIADQVWDELVGDHVSVGTMGDAINDHLEGNVPQTGDSYARLGAPAGASVSADIAAAKVDTAATVADTNELQTDWANGGRLDLLIDAIKAVTDVLPDSGALTSLATAAALTTVDGVVDAIKVVTDALTAAAAAKLALSAAGIVSGSAITGTLSTTQATTDLTEATDDHYNGGVLVWTSGVLAGQRTDVTDYTGATKLLTFTACTEAPGNGDTFVIL